MPIPGSSPRRQSASLVAFVQNRCSRSMLMSQLPRLKSRPNGPEPIHRFDPLPDPPRHEPHRYEGPPNPGWAAIETKTAAPVPSSSARSPLPRRRPAAPDPPAPPGRVGGPLIFVASVSTTSSLTEMSRHRHLPMLRARKLRDGPVATTASGTPFNSRLGRYSHPKPIPLRSAGSRTPAKSAWAGTGSMQFHGARAGTGIRLLRRILISV